MAKADPEKQVLTTVDQIVAMESQLATEQELLMQDERFADFIRKQQDYAERIAKFWKSVEDAMIVNNIKTVKGDWGYVTVAERDSFKGNIDLLPRKFVKKTADVKAIGEHYKLTGTLPAGADVTHTKYLTKKLKG
jgi:hypothetical protein